MVVVDAMKRKISNQIGVTYPLNTPRGRLIDLQGQVRLKPFANVNHRRQTEIYYMVDEKLN
jgi:hypothetical protein